MRSRRNFIGLCAASTIVSLSGCVGILESGNSGSNEEPNISFDTEVGSSEQQYKVYASIDYNDANGVSLLYNGKGEDEVYSERIQENPQKRRLYLRVEEGTTVRVVAYYSDDFEDYEEVGSFVVDGEKSVTV